LAKAGGADTAKALGWNLWPRPLAGVLAQEDLLQEDLFPEDHFQEDLFQEDFLGQNLP
jgi:hypothetical protein